MIDKNAVALPGARGIMAVLALCALADALLIVGQAWGLASALVVAWSLAGTAEGASFAEGLQSAGGDVAVFAACYVLRQIVAFARGRLMDSFAQRRATDLRASLADAIYDRGQAFVQRHGQGVTTVALVDGVDQVKTYLALIFPKIVDLMVVPAALTIALFAIDWVSGLIALVMLPCIIWYMRMLGANAHDAAARQHGEYERLSNHFMDTMRGIPTLKYFGRSRGYARRVFQVSERFREATVKTLKTATLSSLVLDLFRTFALAAVAIMLGFRLMAGWIDLLPALACLIIVPEYFAPVRRYASDFHASLDGANQLKGILAMLGEKRNASKSNDRAKEASDATDAAQACANGDARELAPWTADSELRFEHVCFSYGTEEEEGRAFALEDISFSARGFANIGIIGPSGSGKSTLAHLVAGFCQPASGRILVGEAGGESMPAELSHPSWLTQVAYIPQNPHVFSMTLRDNIAFYCPDASEEQIEQAMSAVGLDALADELPRGLDTLVGQGGRALSGGQAQRVALARALLDERRRIWVLDEPTAHLDIETELELKNRMVPLMEGRLVIFATHRMHWMDNMDYVLSLENGKLKGYAPNDRVASREPEGGAR